MLDDKYGIGERLRTAYALVRDSNVNDELSQMYEEIQFDLLYF